METLVGKLPNPSKTSSKQQAPQTQKLFIVLPAYNEEGNLPSLLQRIINTMAYTPVSSYEVVVVNDGSKDNTLTIAQQWAKKMPINVVNHPINKGLGQTIRDGLFTASQAADQQDIIIALDADDTQPPELIPRMIQQIREGHDVVIASRFQKGARVMGLSRFRELTSVGASWLFRILFPIRGVRDFTCGFRAYRATTLKKAFAHYGDEQFIDQEGFQCMVDILLKLRKLDVVFGELPFILRYDFKAGASKMNVGKTIKNTLRLVVRRWLE
ncbi:MAG: glycosyltransferase family 2 protein [Bacteroidota bacterium]